MHRHRIEPDAAVHNTWRLPRDHVINRASDQTRTDRGFYKYRELTRDGVMLARGIWCPGPSGEDATDVRGDDQGDRDPVERAERFTEDSGADGGGKRQD